MKQIHRIAGFLSVLALVVLLGSFIVASLFSSGAQLVQLIEPGDAAVASLFGDAQTDEPVGTKIGTPQLIVIRDQSAFLEGTGAQGERFANMQYLNENKIYPVQVKTIDFFRNLTALISVLGGSAMAGLWLWTRLRLKRQTVA
jgi:hypothetical protein